LLTRFSRDWMTVLERLHFLNCPAMVTFTAVRDCLHMSRIVWHFVRLVRPKYNAALRFLDEGLASQKDMDLTCRLGLGYADGAIERVIRGGLVSHTILRRCSSILLARRATLLREGLLWLREGPNRRFNGPETDAGIEPPVIGGVSRQARPITFRKVERHALDNTRCHAPATRSFGDGVRFWPAIAARFR
jgi:hypothetical protein